uniref:Uncharacterized protein n=1 Tax=Arundo donax TaxID=35708 RepID=A0A0A9DZY6_ARUDO
MPAPHRMSMPGACAGALVAGAAAAVSIEASFWAFGSTTEATESPAFGTASFAFSRHVNRSSHPSTRA